MLVSYPSFLLLRRQFLLLVLEHHSVIYLVFFWLDVLEGHRVALGDPLHHFFDIPWTDGMVITARIEHVVGKWKRDYAIVVTSEFLDLFHLGPLVNSDLSIVASSIEMAIAKFKCQNPSSQAFNKLLIGKFLNDMWNTSGASGSNKLRS